MKHYIPDDESAERIAGEAEMRQKAEALEQNLRGAGFGSFAVSHTGRNATSNDLQRQVDEMVKMYGGKEGVIQFFRHPIDDHYEVRIYFK